MRDSAVVLRVENQFAWVRVNPLADCGACSARALCIGRQDAAGRITVHNPLRALPGDEVEIEVPEANYQKDMSLLFSLLLFASLAGLGIGYLVRPVDVLTPNGNSILGLALSLLLAGAGIFRYYGKKRKKNNFPVIVEIIKRGGSHGKA